MAGTVYNSWQDDVQGHHSQYLLIEIKYWALKPHHSPLRSTQLNFLMWLAVYSCLVVCWVSSYWKLWVTNIPESTYIYWPACVTAVFHLHGDSQFQRAHIDQSGAALNGTGSSSMSSATGLSMVTSCRVSSWLWKCIRILDIHTTISIDTHYTNECKRAYDGLIQITWLRTWYVLL